MNSELMMDIAVDITPIEPKPSGVGLYVANLIKCLAELQIQENFKLRLVYQPRLKNWLRRNFDFPPSLPTNVQLSLLPIPVRISNLLLALPVNSLVSGYFENHLQSPDILHGNSYSVFPCRGSCKLMTIYDLTFIKYPDYANSVMKGYAQKIKQCLPWTDLIITISENSKREIVEYLEIDSNRVWVTPLASRYSSDYLTSDRDEQLTKLAGYDFSQPYLLFVSTIEPRKNIITLIAAF